MTGQKSTWKVEPASERVGPGLGPRCEASRNNPANDSGQKPNSDVLKGPLKFQERNLGPMKIKNPTAARYGWIQGYKPWPSLSLSQLCFSRLLPLGPLLCRGPIALAGSGRGRLQFSRLSPCLED